MSSRVLIILGNGYDVAFQYPTRYIDFYNNSRELRNYAYMGNELCLHILNTYKKEDTLWSDLEQGLYLYSKEMTMKYGAGNETAAKVFQKDFNELRSALFSYLNSVSSKSTQIEGYAAPLGLSVEWNKANPQFLTFNYSSTTFTDAVGVNRDYLNRDDSINTERFIYQHGSIYDPQAGRNNGPETIVLGIDEEIQQVEHLHSFLYKSNQRTFNLRETMTNIDQKSLYIIYGCSIGDSDAIYFKRLLNQKDKEYIIYYYDDNALQSIKSNIGKMCGSFSRFEIDNKVTFLPLKDVAKTRNKTKQLLKEYI